MPESNQKNNRSALLSYAVSILSRRPYFSSQLQKKLQERAEKLSLENYQTELENIISELQTSGYLNDDYLISGYIKRCLAKFQGPKIIAFKLRNLGLASTQIQTSLNREDAKQAIAEAKDNLAAKYKNLEDFKLRHKLYQRGF